jgi:hypothetical protein
VAKHQQGKEKKFSSRKRGIEIIHEKAFVAFIDFFPTRNDALEKISVEK